MSAEPVSVSVQLLGEDLELQYLGACVQLLETTHPRPLTPAERAGIVRYLCERYVAPVQP